MQKDLYAQQQQTKALFSYSTYESLDCFLEELVNSEEELHIFSLNSIAKSIKNKLNIKALSIDDIFRYLFEGYHDVETKIYLQARLRKFINEGDYVHNNYLLNRLTSIVNTFYAFADFGVEEIPNGIKGTREKEEVIQLINQLLKEEVFIDYNNLKNSLTKEDISVKLCGHSHLNKIFFYEIEYLNYGRMNLIHLLRQKGFKIEFRIPYHSEFRHTFEFWKQVYEVVTKQEVNDTRNKSKINENGQRLALFNENKQANLNDRNDVKVYQFHSQHDFQEYYRRTNDSIFSINPEEVNTIVNNTFHSLYENSVGKFIYHLQYCTYIEGDIQLSYNQLIELITSDWVKLGNVKGTDALSFMIDLTEYMAGIKTTGDVKERLAHLQDLDLVSKSFDKENADDTGRNRMKRYMLNPFRTFSFLHPERYEVTIKQLIDLIEEFEALCNGLLSNESEVINVNTYFEKWEETLKTVINDGNWGIWKKVFAKRFPSEWEFAGPELLSLVYLTAFSFDNDEMKVHSLPNLQQKVFQSNQDTSLHLTNITQMNFPEEHYNSLSDFFNHSELKAIVQMSASWIKNRLLHALWVDFSVEEHFSKLGIYQLYNILTNYKGPVKFSWINNLHENGIRNIYLEILADLYNSGEVETYKQHDEAAAFQIPQREKSVLNMEMKDISGKIPGVFWLNHDFCSKKFFLTSFIDQQPIYDQEFHHQFLFSKIGKLFSLSQTERESFRQIIYPMFPHWTFTKKENLIDMEYQTKLRKYINYENISYPRELKSLHILRSVYRENRRTKARNQYRKDKDFNDKDVIQQFKENINQYHVQAEPGNHCKMCQYLNICSEGVFAIDNNSY